MIPQRIFSFLKQNVRRTRLNERYQRGVRYSTSNEDSAGKAASGSSEEKPFFLAEDNEIHGKDAYPAKKEQGYWATPRKGILSSFHAAYEHSISDPESFWSEIGKETVSWFAPFSHAKYSPTMYDTNTNTNTTHNQTTQQKFEQKEEAEEAEHGLFSSSSETSWFADGKLNVAYNCIDRHLKTKGHQTAILWEGDDGEVRKYSYSQLYVEVGKAANALRSLGVRKGDAVAIYMPMIPETAITMLACARIGAMHTVIFAGFSAEAVRERVLNSKAKVVVTADNAVRAGKLVPLKRTVDEALLACPFVHSVVVFKRTGGGNLPWHPTRDISYTDLIDRQRSTSSAEVMDSEDPLFLLYTSGSTGKPKGLMHSTGGYLVQTALSHKIIFDYRPGDVYACMADVGWITGHSYILYGPLCNGATTFMFEGTPLYPNAERYWKMVEKHRLTQFYTAPTALRSLMKFGDDPVKKYDRSSLRILGTVGEPINPEAWRWYYNVVGEGRCSIVDTYWQTETGSIVFTSIPGVTKMKPGSAGVPFFGVRPALGDAETNSLIHHADPHGQKHGVLLMQGPWPSQARTILDDHQRFISTYFSPFPGYFFTGDGCTVDSDGFFWISGRVDDVINKAGHRLGTAEIEGALTQYHECSEAAVIGIPDPMKGQAILAFCVLRSGLPDDYQKLCEDLRAEVRKHIGGLAVPDIIVPLTGLPKTRSGKIMRRLLRKIAQNETKNLGDLSTLNDPDIIDEIIQQYTFAQQK